MYLLLFTIFQVDQPAGTGFSSGVYDYGENGVQIDFYAFLQEFYKNLPQYKNNSLYITGKNLESYTHLQGCHGEFEPDKAHSTVVGIICPPGSDRVN